MRLLQLATGPGELIDLHPNVTVVAGLDRTGRQLLADAVVGLAQGRASGQRGLLEAHGVLFDLAPEALALLDIVAGDIEPVVTLDDLPRARPAPPAAPVPADLQERWGAAHEEDRIAQAAVVAAAEAVARARAAATAERPERPTIAALTAERDHAMERHRQLSTDLAGLARVVADTARAREAGETSTADVRALGDEAGARCAEVAARLDAARAGRDPDAVAALDEATAALSALEAELEAAEAARDAAGVEADAEAEDPAERLARIDEEIGSVTKRLTAYGPADVERVTSSLEPLRAVDGQAVAPLEEAVALADELQALDADLVATDAKGGTPGAGLAEGRARLDAARQGLSEAEQAVRRPDHDRDVVDRLEQVHADLLDAIDKAGSRFAGARSQRRVDALRAEESVILHQLDLPSYSDYMMGSSLLHVDPVKEAALDAARIELGDAEAAWELLSTETETELARAERMEHRRGLVDEARRILGRPVTQGTVIAELRALRVPAEPPAELMRDLRQALDDVGVAVADEDLPREDLVVLAEAWLAEAKDAAGRERSLRQELARLQDDRSDARVDLEAAEARGTRQDALPEPPCEERLADARAQLVEAEERHLAHLAVEREVAALAEELAEAEAAGRVATEAAAAAAAAVLAAVQAEEAAVAAHARAEADLAAAAQAEIEASEQLRQRDAQEDEDPVAQLAGAEAAHKAAAARAVETASVLAGLDELRQAAMASGAPDGGPASGPVAVSEEIEWYLLARLAAQRSLSLGGSLPLLLDDALTDLSDVDVDHVLGRLERMADAVQVIVVSDDPAVAAWAGLAGADRAAVVRPEAASTV